MSAKHSPTPWRVVIDGTCSAAWPHVLGADQDDDSCDEAIAELDASHVERSTRGAPGTCKEKPQRFKPSKGHERVMANAQHIVQCVNAHDALVAALEAFLRAPSIGSGGPGSVTLVVQDFNMRAARTALAIARGSKA